MAGIRNLVTMGRAAETLDEDVGRLIGIAIELEPEGGFLTVCGSGEMWLYAFTDDGIETLKDLIHTLRTES